MWGPLIIIKLCQCHQGGFSWSGHTAREAEMKNTRKINASKPELGQILLRGENKIKL
jgi:hypothetical protein